LAVYETNYRLPHCSKKGAGERHSVLSRDTRLSASGLRGNTAVQTLVWSDFSSPNNHRLRTPGVWPRFFLMLTIAGHITCLHSQVSDSRPKRGLGMHAKRHLADPRTQSPASLLNLQAQLSARDNYIICHLSGSPPLVRHIRLLRRISHTLARPCPDSTTPWQPHTFTQSCGTF
jgi:hypothetical protein